MSDIETNNNQVEKFKTEIADSIGVKERQFNDAVQRLKDREFPFSHSPSFEAAMREMGIKEKHNKIEVSLDTEEIKVTTTEKQTVSPEMFSQFSDNVSNTLQAHGGLAGQYAKSTEIDGFQKFGHKAVSMGESIEKLSGITTVDEQIEVIATIGTGTTTIYKELESTEAAKSHDGDRLVKLGKKLYEYVVALPESPDKRNDALLDNNISTIQALKDADNPKLNKIQLQLESQLRQTIGNVAEMTISSSAVNRPTNGIAPDKISKKTTQHSR